MVQRTYYPPATSDAPPPAEVGPAEELHGYTLDDIHRVAHHVIRADRWYRASDVTDRLDAVWFAIVEYLCTAPVAPTRKDLFAVGIRASDRHVQGELQTHGYASADPSAGAGGSTGFQRYWWSTRTASHENRIIERQALAQIWPHLTRREQQAFTALAATGSYEEAARILGIATASLRVRIRHARAHFLARWHHGETPSRPWRAGAHDQIKAVDVRGRPRLTVSQVEALRGRYEEGERLRALAAEAGVGVSTLSALLRGTRRPAEDRETS